MPQFQRRSAWPHYETMPNASGTTVPPTNERARAAAQILKFASLRPDSTAQSEDRTALLDSMTDDFVALVCRLMDAGFSLLNIVEFLREQSDMMEQMAGVVGSLLVGEGKQPRSHSACIIPPGIQRFVGRQAARCRCRVG